MKKTTFAILVASALPLGALAATYDDLISAARLGDTKDIAKLIQRGASVDTTDKEGNTLLMLAARAFSLIPVRRLGRGALVPRPPHHASPPAVSDADGSSLTLNLRVSPVIRPVPTAS